MVPEISMHAPLNAVPHRYFKDLVHVRMEVAALLEGEETQSHERTAENA